MSDYMRQRYFEEPMLSRQRLLWALATRQQLERWEIYVARDIASVFQTARRSRTPSCGRRSRSTTCS